MAVLHVLLADDAVWRSFAAEEHVVLRSVAPMARPALEIKCNQAVLMRKNAFKRHARAWSLLLDRLGARQGSVVDALKRRHQVEEWACT